jgi:excisionase family DNA binding protein
VKEVLLIMEYLTVQEVAERLRVTPLTVRRWLNSGALSGIHLGNRAGWRISEADLSAFLEARRGPAGAEAQREGKEAA